jgi:predicted GNAT family acetyltransferase
MSAVRDNPAQNRFEMDIGDRLAVANYRLAPGVVTIFHTEVPADVEGRGHGSALVKGTLDLIRARADKVAPRCGFVRAFIARHPEYKDLMAAQ